MILDDKNSLSVTSTGFFDDPFGKYKYIEEVLLHHVNSTLKYGRSSWPLHKVM
jgi:hypothetical protein